MIKKERIELGLCCLNSSLRQQKPSIFCSRSIILKTIEEKGWKEVKIRCKQNIKDVIPMMKWNYKHNIHAFRLSSAIFPHYSNIKGQQLCKGKYKLEKFQKYFDKIYKYAIRYNQRLTFHPGQYNQIGTPHPHIFKKTILDLSMHAEILDRIGCDKHSIMVVHGGGVYGDKQKTIQRWISQFKQLPEFIKKRIVIENDEKCYSVEDLLPISKELNIPIVMDTHHYECFSHYNPDITQKSGKKLVKKVLKTWERRGIKPKFHVSNQGKGRCGHHSDYIDHIPEYILEIPEKYNIDITLMVEAKKKELAILDICKKFQ